MKKVLLKIFSVATPVVLLAYIRGEFYAGAISWYGALILGFNWPPMTLISIIAVMILYVWIVWPTMYEEPSNKGEQNEKI